MADCQHRNGGSARLSYALLKQSRCDSTGFHGFADVVSNQSKQLRRSPENAVLNPLGIESSVLLSSNTEACCFRDKT